MSLRRKKFHSAIELKQAMKDGKASLGEAMVYALETGEEVHLSPEEAEPISGRYTATNSPRIDQIRERNRPPLSDRHIRLD